MPEWKHRQTIKMRCHGNTASHLIKQYEKKSLNIAFHIHVYIGVFLPDDP